MTDSILIVDDESSIRNTLRVILEDEGLNVFTAASGEEVRVAVDMPN